MSEYIFTIVIDGGDGPSDANPPLSPVDELIRSITPQR